MPLTIVPPDIFDKVTQNRVVEDSESFSFRDMELKHSRTSYDLQDYMNRSNCQFAGRGSSRVAYLLPPGSIDNADNSASCLKIAINRPGVGQNETEIRIFSNYGKKYSCFPRMYSYDMNQKLYIVTEFGKRLESDNVILNYFKEWNDTIIKYQDLEDTFYLIESRDMLAENLLEYSNARSALKFKFKRFLNEIKNAGNGKYDSYISLFDFLDDDGSNDLIINDFNSYDNWAFVSRDSVLMLLPIDFGFSKQVRDKYYGTNRNKNWAF